MQGIKGHMVALMIEKFKKRPFDLSGFKLEEDKQVQTERTKLNDRLAKLLAAQQSLDNVSHTAAFIPANQFQLGTYQESIPAAVPDLADADELLTKPGVRSTALPPSDKPHAPVEYSASEGSQSSNSSSSSQAGDSAASTAASTAASSKSSTPLPITVLADSFSDTSSSEPAAPALDLNDAVAESSSAGSAAEVETHPESVSPTSSSTSDDFVEV